MVRRAVGLSAVIVAMLGPNVIVGGAAEPITTLALQRADMPATTKKSTFSYPEVQRTDALGAVGAREAVHYVYMWPVGTLKTPIGTIDKEWVVEGNVFRAADENGAKRLFAVGRAANIGHFSYESVPGEPKNLNLPAYGVEQIARVTTHPGTGMVVMVFVRTGTVVWQMRVAASPLQFQPTEAEMVAVLEMYAAKQKARVGAG
jgi:hypothetical protein